MPKEKNEQFSSTGKFLNTIIEMSPFAMWISDTQGNIIKTNRTLRDTIQLNDEEIVGNYNVLKDVNLEKQGVMPMVKAVFTKLETARFSIPWIGANAGTSDLEKARDMFIDVAMFPILSDKGELTNVVCQWADISKYKQAEEDLKKSEIKLRLVLDATPFPIAVVDVEDNNILYWSRSAHELFGHTAPTASEWYEIAYPDPDYRNEVIERWKDVLVKARETRKPENTGVYRVTCANGTERLCELYATFLDENLIVTFNDITKRIKTAKAVKASEIKFRTLYESMAQGVTYQNSKGEIIDANPAALRILGLTFEQMIGRSSTDNSWHSIHEDGSEFPGDSHPSIKALKTGKQINDVEMGVYNPIEQTYRWIKIDAIPQFKNGEKKPYQVFSTFDDITAEKKAAFLLKENEERYIKAQQLGKVGNWEYNLQTTHFWGSEEARRIFGFSPDADDFTTEFVEDCIPDRKRVHQALVDLIEQNKTYNLIYEVHPKNGGPSRMANSIAEVIMDEQGNPLKVIGVIQDVTERIEREKEIKNYQKSLQDLTTEISLVEEKHRKQIAANIHDHLSQSLVISRMKLSDLQKEAQNEKFLAEIQSVIGHISSALENSRKITYELSPPILYELGLVETMYWLLEKISEEYKIETEFITEIEELPLSESQLILVFRIIQEVINNTIKHAYAKKIKIHFKAISGGLDIVVSDDGKGFDVKQLSRVNVYKSGFGLFAVKERVQNLKGNFSIHSNTGEGTEVKIFVPLISN
ncbi:MAG: PAS domain S-box protein [Bacteroidales bacterium]|nr:PAS domain S-box protein [Bacteroidales bacterium]MCF8403204.1 PAS domain S-box protein [Bacteroidales bacterium]